MAARWWWFWAEHTEPWGIPAVSPQPCLVPRLLSEDQQCRDSLRRTTSPTPLSQMRCLKQDRGFWNAPALLRGHSAASTCSPYSSLLVWKEPGGLISVIQYIVSGQMLRGVFTWYIFSSGWGPHIGLRWKEENRKLVILAMKGYKWGWERAFRVRGQAFQHLFI